MLQTLKLLLPALIPSWRFFDVIEASPRIEFTLLKTAGDTAARWQEFRPRPGHLSVIDMVKRMVWNPRWNESLFLVSCAERLIINPTQHSHDEILKRIIAELERSDVDGGATPYLQFRLMFVSRDGDGGGLHKQVAFTSLVHPCFEGGGR